MVGNRPTIDMYSTPKNTNYPFKAWRSLRGLDRSSRFLTGQQAANLPVLLAAWSAVLDRGRQTGGLFWSADLQPRRVHLFPPRLLSKSEASMCRREMGGGVNDLHCCATHSWGVLKPGNS